MKKIMSALLVGLFVFAMTSAHAAMSPLSVSVLKPVQFPPEEFSVTGLRLSLLWGQHRDLYGLDFGLIGNITEQAFVGLGVSGIFNDTRGNTTILGLQLAGIGNFNSGKTDVFGLQAAVGVNSNTAESSVTGLQIAALANLSEHTKIYGAQIGLYNRAYAVYGFQIGLVNVTDSLHGIQIGLVNFNHTGLFTVSPILNVGF